MGEHSLSLVNIFPLLAEISFICAEELQSNADDECPNMPENSANGSINRGIISAMSNSQSTKSVHSICRTV